MLGVRDIKGKIEGILTDAQEQLLIGKPTSSTIYKFRYNGPGGEINESILIPRLTRVSNSEVKAGDQISVERVDDTLVIEINRSYFYFFKKLKHRYVHFLFE